MFKASEKGKDVIKGGIGDITVDSDLPLLKVYQKVNYSFNDSGTSDEFTKCVFWDFNLIPIVWIFIRTDDETGLHYNGWADAITGDTLKARYYVENDKLCIECETINLSGINHTYNIHVVITSNDMLHVN